MKKEVVDPYYAKSKGYRKVIENIRQKGVCPFCPENFTNHKHPILRRAGTWFVTRNTWPYENSQHHFVIINTVHKEKMAELTATDFQNIQRLLQWTVRKFRIRGGGFAMRFGETSHTGATVCHLHGHLIVPKINKRTGRARPVFFPIG